MQLLAHFGRRGNPRGAVDFGRNRRDLVPQAVGARIDKTMRVGFAIDEREHRLRKPFGASAPFRPMARHHGLGTEVGDHLLQQRDLGRGVLGEMVDAHHAWQPVMFADVV